MNQSTKIAKKHGQPWLKSKNYSKCQQNIAKNTYEWLTCDTEIAIN